MITGCTVGRPIFPNSTPPPLIMLEAPANGPDGTNGPPWGDGNALPPIVIGAVRGTAAPGKAYPAPGTATPVREDTVIGKFAFERDAGGVRDPTIPPPTADAAAAGSLVGDNLGRFFRRPVGVRFEAAAVAAAEDAVGAA